LSDPAVVRLISTSFVPVALDQQTAWRDKGEAHDFVESVQNRTKPAQYQGLWVVTSDGAVLATAGRGHQASAPWEKTVLADLEAGLKKFGPVAPRRAGPANSRPYRGIGVHPDGSVTLAVTDRLIFVQDRRRQLRAGDFGEVTPDHVDLTAAEWSALSPPDVNAVSPWTIPEAVGRRFFPLLGHVTEPFRHPEDVTEVQLEGRVVAVRDGIASLVFGGQMAGIVHGTKSLMQGHELSTTMRMIGGVGSYDIRAGQMLSLTWVCDGDFLGWHRPSAHVSPFRFGTVVEWRRGGPKAGAQLEAEALGPETTVEVADSTPEDALKTFLLALAAQDEPTLRAVTLPHAAFDVLLKSPPAQPEQFARLRARLEEKPMKRLKKGDPVRMPNGESRVIKPDDVREGRTVLWPAGAPLPSRLENVGGHWKVFADPFIAARK
jgi:hypothetical protein